MENFLCSKNEFLMANSMQQVILLEVIILDIKRCYVSSV